MRLAGGRVGLVVAFTGPWTNKVVNTSFHSSAQLTGLHRAVNSNVTII